MPVCGAQGCIIWVWPLSAHPVELQVLKGEWAGREGELQALADEREAIVNVAGAGDRATQILDRADLGRIVKDGEADDLP